MKGKRSVKWSLTGTLYSLHLQYKLVFNRGYHSFYTPKHIEKAPPDPVPCSHSAVVG